VEPKFRKGGKICLGSTFSKGGKGGKGGCVSNLKTNCII
jgi:hypothetical protein